MKQQSFVSALTPIIFLIGLLSLNVFLYGDNALGGANQLALLLAASLAAIIGVRNGFNWKEILNGVSKSISSTTPAILILLLIGSLAGTWLISGIVPTMIYYGLQIISPKIFLVAACIICAIAVSYTHLTLPTILRV